MILNKKDIKEINSSHIKCDGTINVEILLNNGRDLEVYGLTQKQEAMFVRWYETEHLESLEIDDRLLSQTDKQWLRQNGISERV